MLEQDLPTAVQRVDAVNAPDARSDAPASSRAPAPMHAPVPPATRIAGRRVRLRRKTTPSTSTTATSVSASSSSATSFAHDARNTPMTMPPRRNVMSPLVEVDMSNSDLLILDDVG